jgi:hypothetical protein
MSGGCSISVLTDLQWIIVQTLAHPPFCRFAVWCVGVVDPALHIDTQPRYRTTPLSCPLSPTIPHHPAVLRAAHHPDRTTPLSTIRTNHSLLRTSRHSSGARTRKARRRTVSQEAASCLQTQLHRTCVPCVFRERNFFATLQLFRKFSQLFHNFATFRNFSATFFGRVP